MIVLSIVDVELQALLNPPSKTDCCRCEKQSVTIDIDLERHGAGQARTNYRTTKKL